MRAAWYDRRGPAGEVLVVGDLPDAQPALRLLGADDFPSCSTSPANPKG